MTLIAGLCALSTAVLPASAQARSATTSAPAKAYCATLPASKVSSIMGFNVQLFDTFVQQGGVFVCVYGGRRVEVDVYKRSGLQHSQIATQQTFEALVINHPKVKANIQLLPKVGRYAFSWTATLNRGAVVGVATRFGTTAYYVKISTGAHPGSLARYLPAIQRLLALAS
jgi:hypothetical protein